MSTPETEALATDLPEAEGPTAPATAPKAELARKHLVFGAVGVGIGLAAGLLLAQIQLPAGSNVIADAVESCSAGATEGMSVLDDGRSISMDTEGEEEISGAPYDDVTCVLGALEAPQSVLERIGTTRALDGRQTGEWDGFSASWGYHPDNGLNIVVELADR